MSCRDILVVEDDQDISESLRDLLESEGYHVATAANGREGIEVLRAQNLQPCVVLLDLMMPVMNGWQFLEAKAADDGLSAIPVVVVSAYGDRFDSACKATAGFISKPIDLGRLLGLVHRLCD